MTGIHNFIIYKGATFNPVLNYSSPDFTVKIISAITRSVRARVTATAHTIGADKWRVFVGGVVGMKQINNSRHMAYADKAYNARVIDANTLELDIDSSEFSAYASGGEIAFNTPIDLTGYTARMQIRSDVDSDTVLVSLTTENGGITLGGTDGTVTLLISATATAALTWDEGVYDLELVSSGGVATRLVSGRIAVSDEVTRA